MILSKDLQEILEGVHYFLSEALPAEPLSGKLECLRRGLVLQLEALSISYPILRIRARSSASLPYLAMDQGNIHGVQHRSESMSSGSSGSNSYSNSSSGDGLVVGPGRGGCATLDRQHLQQNFLQDEEYEDFQDSKGDNGILEEKTERGRYDADEREDIDDVYMESVEPVSFSNVIATCDKHGILVKKTKGLLRNVKNYYCVAASGLLYLYLKETDERQRKTIDLTGYSARVATGEDIRDQRKRDAAFEIVGPGKKTHTFIARTARDKVEWLAAIDRTIKSGRNRTPTSVSSVVETVQNANGSGDTHAGNTEHILPPKAPPPLHMIQKRDGKPAEEYFYYHDVASDVKEEVYEPVGSEGVIASHFETLPPPPPSLLTPQSTELPDYDPVCPDDLPPPLPEGPLPSTPKLGRQPPGRPPPPTVVQDRINKQAGRPLPEAPSEPSEVVDDPIGIYCEIEEDEFETSQENLFKDIESGKENNIVEAINLKNSDHETKSKQGCMLSEGLPNQKNTEAPPLPSRASSNSLVGFFSDEIFINISELSPAHHSHRYPSRSPNPKTPPRLPPKGIPFVPTTDDDSEYKVPTVLGIDSEYQIPPSNPIPTEAVEKEGSEAIHAISGPIPTASQIYQVPPTQTIVSIKPSTNERRNSIVDEHSKPLSSFFSGKDDPYPKNNLKALTKRFENMSDSQPVDELKDVKWPGHGTSVKDMIARLNKNKNMTEKDQPKTKEEPLHQPLTIDDKVDGEPHKSDPSHESVLTATDTEQKLVKPALPPRPHNLLNGNTLTQKNMPPIKENQSSDSKTENGNVSDDDHYETPDDNSFDNAFQQDSRETSQTKDTTVLREITPETAGDWYVAKFAFVATIDQALSFNRGDPVFVHDTSGSSGWWRATCKGRSGLVPREYLKKKE